MKIVVERVRQSDASGGNPSVTPINRKNLRTLEKTVKFHNNVTKPDPTIGEP